MVFCGLHAPYYPDKATCLLWAVKAIQQGQSACIMISGDLCQRFLITNTKNTQNVVSGDQSLHQKRSLVGG